VPLLNGVNTWASAQAFSVRPTFNSATPWDSANLATPQSAAGVTDGSSAAAGRIGEVITASVDSGSAVSLTAGTAANITSISLTAGDWDVRGQCATAPAGSTIQTVTACAVNTTSATLPGGGNLTGYIYLPFTASAGQPVIAPTSVSRVNVSSTTTVFLVINSSFSTSTNTAYGVIVARRIR
jgi:hypothetical protein